MLKKLRQDSLTGLQFLSEFLHLFKPSGVMDRVCSESLDGQKLLRPLWISLALLSVYDMLPAMCSLQIK